MKTRSQSQLSSYEMDYNTKEQEQQYEDFMAKNSLDSPAKFQEIMQQRKTRPSPPNFDDTEPDEPRTATPFPLAEQLPPTVKAEDRGSSLGGFSTQIDPQEMLRMMSDMKKNCCAMEEAAKAKDRQIEQLMAALAAQKEASERQAIENFRLRQQIAQPTIAPDTRPDTDYYLIPDTKKADTIPDTKPDASEASQPRARFPDTDPILERDIWEPVELSTGYTTNQFDELVVSFILPSTITSDRKDVFDIPSLIDYILKKRPDIKATFPNDNDTGYVLLAQARVAAAKISATVRTLSPAGKILATMQMISVSGDDHRRGDMQLAVEHGLKCSVQEIQLKPYR